MQLRELIEGLPKYQTKGDIDLEIAGIAYDSRNVGPGDLFVCIKGFVENGHDYIRQALVRGAVAVVVEEGYTASYQVPCVTVPNTRQALAHLAKKFYGHPSSQLKLIGITGTNGKTTTSYLIKSILRAAGYEVGLVGTISYAVGHKVQTAPRTTPESLDLQRLLREMVDAGMDYAVLEVSSHSLELERVAGCEFACAVFTNISQDHLDFHPSLEHYVAAKQKLFKQLGKEACAVINMDDAWAERMVEATAGRVLGYSVKHDAQVSVEEYKSSLEGISATLNTSQGRFALQSPLIGEYNLYNLLAAVGVALEQGVDQAVICKGIAGMKQVPGRFESIDCREGFGVVVDYAHTDDALMNLLTTASKLCTGRLITVFGCGGERDAGKRPKMGKIAADLSDFSIITSDNPRSEDPMQIINQVEQGMIGADKDYNDYLVCPDRFWAIHQAINMAKPGDLVVISGKGHEDYQVLADKTISFDDREVARQLLEQIS
jgi:UDP-N-acetylmuramoyl-L-alanyl-D-glutamate--2,6-diaminopimelate ligase